MAPGICSVTLTELRFFVALAQQQHFGRAARLCHVSQPTLSMGIKKLEQTLGLSLFERGSQVRLTAEAVPLLACAEAALAQVQALQDLAQLRQDPLQGPLRLGVHGQLGAYWLPQAQAQLAFLAPRMPLSLVEAEVPVLLERLKRAELDVVLVGQALSLAEGVCQHLVDEPYVLLMPKGHRLSGTAALPWDALCGEMLVLPQGDAALVDALAAPADLPLTWVELSRELVCQLVAAGQGLSLVPQSQAQVLAGRSWQWRALQAPVYRPLNLLWRVNFSRPKALDALGQAIKTGCSLFWPHTQPPGEAGLSPLPIHGW
jgi:LysR family transcriptional regulator, hydrogen peroxide-inducible genes activator